MRGTAIPGDDPTPTFHFFGFGDSSCSFQLSGLIFPEAARLDQTGFASRRPMPDFGHPDITPLNQASMIGTTISHYQIDEELGRGGMGVVYKATDTKLNRTVALKFLPPHVVAAEKDKVRFRREAQAAAGLSHPNIATVFAIEEAEDQAFIAMEFVDGETLADRIERGPLKVDDAIDIAIQIASGLQAAHEQQIVHRDIKPSNIMLTSRGHIKIMDFGLAKVSQASMLTQTGSTLGTVGYMSPEQARGEDVDRRTDIWGLGCVLYQMITGRTPFVGEYEQAIVYSILNSDPEPLTSLRTGVPIALDGIMAKILAKDPSMRYQHVDELPADLKAVKAGASGTMMSRAMPAYSSASMAPAAQSVAAPAGVSREVSAVEVRNGFPYWLPWGVAGLGLAAALVLFLLRPAPPEPEPVRHFVLPNVDANASLIDPPTISKDGSVINYIEYSDGGRLYSQFLNEADRVDLGDLVVGNRFVRSVATSPAGQWVSFWTPDGVARRSTRGGSTELIASNGGTELSWSSGSSAIGIDEALVDGVNMFTVNEISESGAQTLVEFAVEDAQAAVMYPEFLPDHNLLLYTQATPQTDEGPHYQVMALDVSSEDTAPTVVVRRATKPRYLDNGYLVFTRGNDLFAARFDPGSLTVGASFPVLGGIRVSNGGFVPRFDLSRNGVLVHEKASTVVESTSPTVAFFEPADGPNAAPKPFEDFTLSGRDHRFSPDGSKVLVHSMEGDSDIWLIDRELDLNRRVTFGAEEDETPEWDPDGNRFYFSGQKEGTEYLLRSSVDNPTAVDTLDAFDSHLHIESVSTDGRYVFFTIRPPDARTDIYVYDVEADESRPIVESPYAENGGDLSPGGRWLVYSSDEGGNSQVYLNRFPEMDRSRTLTGEGSYGALWSEDGRSIYYISEGQIMNMPVVDGAPGSPRPVNINYSSLALGAPGHRNLDVLGNGDEFVAGFRMDGVSLEAKLHVVTGFQTLVEQMDPERTGR